MDPRSARKYRERLIPGWANIRRIADESRGVGPHDKNCTICLIGTTNFTLLFEDPILYDKDFSCMVLNEDANVAKTIVLTGSTTFELNPGACVIVFVQNLQWRVFVSSAAIGGAQRTLYLESFGGFPIGHPSENDCTAALVAARDALRAGEGDRIDLGSNMYKVSASLQLDNPLDDGFAIIAEPGGGLKMTGPGPWTSGTGGVGGVINITGTRSLLPARTLVGGASMGFSSIALSLGNDVAPGDHLLLEFKHNRDIETKTMSGNGTQTIFPLGALFSNLAPADTLQSNEVRVGGVLKVAGTDYFWATTGGVAHDITFAVAPPNAANNIEIKVNHRYQLAFHAPLLSIQEAIPGSWNYTFTDPFPFGINHAFDTLEAIYILSMRKNVHIDITVDGSGTTAGGGYGMTNINYANCLIRLRTNNMPSGSYAVGTGFRNDVWIRSLKDSIGTIKDAAVNLFREARMRLDVGIQESGNFGCNFTWSRDIEYWVQGSKINGRGLKFFGSHNCRGIALMNDVLLVGLWLERYSSNNDCHLSARANALAGDTRLGVALSYGHNANNRIFARLVGFGGNPPAGGHMSISNQRGNMDNSIELDVLPIGSAETLVANMGGASNADVLTGRNYVTLSREVRVGVYRISATNIAPVMHATSPIPAGTTVEMLWDQLSEVDTHGTLDTTTHRLIIPVTGFYEFDMIWRGTNGTAGETVLLQLQRYAAMTGVLTTVRQVGGAAATALNEGRQALNWSGWCDKNDQLRVLIVTPAGSTFLLHTGASSVCEAKLRRRAR